MNLGYPLLHVKIGGALARAGAAPPQRAHLHWVETGPGAADALHSGHGGSVELADGQQAGIGRGMSGAA